MDKQREDAIVKLLDFDPWRGGALVGRLPQDRGPWGVVWMPDTFADPVQERERVVALFRNVEKVRNDRRPETALNLWMDAGSGAVDLWRGRQPSGLSPHLKRWMAENTAGSRRAVMFFHLTDADRGYPVGFREDLTAALSRNPTASVTFLVEASTMAHLQQSQHATIWRTAAHVFGSVDDPKPEFAYSDEEWKSRGR